MTDLSAYEQSCYDSGFRNGYLDALRWCDEMNASIDDPKRLQEEIRKRQDEKAKEKAQAIAQH